MNLYDDIKGVWDANNDEIINKIGSWADAIQNSNIKQARSSFYQWRPLRIYTCVGKSRNKGSITFSVRFHGQEVAEINVKGKEVFLKIKPNHFKHNNDYFQKKIENQLVGKDIVGNLLPKGEYPWVGRDAREFRKYFSYISKNCHVSTGVGEHEIESRFIEEMSRASSSKSKILLVDNIKPVTIHNCPLQFPLPIKASGGSPVFVQDQLAGHIDILARRKSKGKVRLSLWELKSPGKLANAIQQAYIYAVTLLLMLRSPLGQKWYNLYGFKGKVPLNLELEAVIAVSIDQKDNLLRKYGEQKTNLKYQIDNDSLRMYAAFYNRSPLKILSFDQLF